ncbi:hypothetical protein CEK25_013494 [Fusarium fujikuroi]|nr:hypothetical protein CEK25_013494 [Fusarium fujikuroi]
MKLYEASTVHRRNGLLHADFGSPFVRFAFWHLIVDEISVCFAGMVSSKLHWYPFVTFATLFFNGPMRFPWGYYRLIIEAVLALINLMAIQYFGEFWTDAIPVGAAIGKVILIVGLIFFTFIHGFGEKEFGFTTGKALAIIRGIFTTFIALGGGNSWKDAFWLVSSKSLLALLVLYVAMAAGEAENPLARFCPAAFKIGVPADLFFVLGEAENPRKILPRAFSTVPYRMTFFFMIAAFRDGIPEPYASPYVIAAFMDRKLGSASAAYVNAMIRLGVGVLPHIGNSMCFVSTSLYGLALEGKAPRFLKILALEGKALVFLSICVLVVLLIYCYLVLLRIALLSYLELSNSSLVTLS